MTTYCDDLLLEAAQYSMMNQYIEPVAIHSIMTMNIERKGGTFDQMVNIEERGQPIELFTDIEFKRHHFKH